MGVYKIQENIWAPETVQFSFIPTLTVPRWRFVFVLGPPIRIVKGLKTGCPSFSSRFCNLYTGTGPILINRLLHIGFLIFRVSWIYPQAFSFKPSLADAN